jgi:hypothetical protein
MSKLVKTKGAILVVHDDDVEGAEPIEIQIATDDAEAHEEGEAPGIRIFGPDGKQLTMERVVKTADGERSYVFFGDEVLEGGAHSFVATLTRSNDGERSLLTQNRLTGQTNALDLPRSAFEVRWGVVE